MTSIINFKIHQMDFITLCHERPCTGGQPQLYEHDVHALLHGRVCPQVDLLRTRGK